MANLDIYCFTHIPLYGLEKLGYKIAGIKKEEFPNSYFTCDSGENIIEKEKYYSEYVFHYWFWKNKLKDYKSDDWVGFCQKRRFWLQENVNIKPKNFDELKNIVLKTIPEKWNNYNSVIQPIMLLKEKKMVMVKRGFKSLIKNPKIFFNKNKHTIKLHFDMHHGYGNLDKAINVMNKKDREDFRNYVNTNIGFSANNMFIAKKDIAEKWFNDVFTWLFACEEAIGFKNLKGYETRIYAYLAERYLSFWFKKYTRSLEWPWVFADLK